MAHPGGALLHHFLEMHFRFGFHGTKTDKRPRAFAITVEPEEGSPVPTSPVVMGPAG